MSDPAPLVRRLAELVSYDTQNPTGDERALSEKLAQDLRGVGASSVETFEAQGHHAVLARFGTAPSRLIVNAHLDTVPANAGYTSPPLTLVEREGRLHGLGSADTKGAIAAALEALSLLNAQGRLPQGCAVLFSGDEERTGTAMRAFLESPRAQGLERAIVCEPTGLRVGHRHRGIAAAEAVATSPGGHSSRADQLPSPVVTLARAAVALDELGRSYRTQGPPGFQGLCMNVAALDGGVAFNVIPSSAKLKMSIRPWPGADLAALLDEAAEVVRRAAAPEPITWSIANINPPFATRDLASFAPLLGDLVRQPLDLAFWTEAALFAERGIDAVVFGPGRIEQAHAADEYVTVDELVSARNTFVKVFAS